MLNRKLTLSFTCNVCDGHSSYQVSFLAPKSMLLLYTGNIFVAFIGLPMCSHRCVRPRSRRGGSSERVASEHMPKNYHGVFGLAEVGWCLFSVWSTDMYPRCVLFVLFLYPRLAASECFLQPSTVRCGATVVGSHDGRVFWPACTQQWGPQSRSCAGGLPYCGHYLVHYAKILWPPARSNHSSKRTRFLSTLRSCQ